MAVINSVVVGRGKKSVGEVTLAYQRGRTIARRRVFENSSRTELQTRQRQLFKTIVKMTSPYKNFFAHSFERTKYGSQFNAFIKRSAERWTSPEFLAAAKYFDVLGGYETENVGFWLVLDVLLNAVNMDTEAQYGDGLPFTGFGSLTPNSIQYNLPYTQRHNICKQMFVTLPLGDGKGWALDLVGYINNSSTEGFDSQAGMFYSKTIDLYEYGALPSWKGTIDEYDSPKKAEVSTVNNDSEIQYHLSAASLIGILLGGYDKTGENGNTGIISVGIRKYQQYMKCSYYLYDKITKAPVI